MLPPKHSAKPVILCIDDERIIIDTLKEQFRSIFKGEYVIEVEDNSESALELLYELIQQKVPIPVIITDQIMPGIKGDELLIKVHEITPETRKILLTGQANTAEIGNALNNAQLFRYIAKPWDPSNLAHTVREAVNGYFYDEIINTKNKEILQAKRELDTFLYRASHDLRRPITTLMGLAELGRIISSQPDVIELFDKTQITAKGMDRLLLKLQSVSIVNDDGLEAEDFVANEVLQSIALRFENELATRNIQLYIDCSLQQINGYKALYEIILSNLIENAITFAGRESPHIRLSLHLEKEFVVLTVEDNGMGIPEEYHEKVFDMFFRANEIATGNGLGLYIVRRAVERLGGSTILKSEAYMGTRISCYIPALPISGEPEKPLV
jgi:signal transduction histidine kinase